MDVVLRNIHKYDSNYYKGIEINEFSEENKYLVKFFGRDVWFDSFLVGKKRSDDLVELSSEDKIRMIVNDYLGSTRIDHFTGIIKFRSVYGNMWFEANGTRYLSFNIKNLQLRSIIDDVYYKYCQDRYNYCYRDNGIKTFMIDTGEFSRYEIISDKLPYDNAKVENIMHFTLKSNSKGIIDSECEFIREFIIDKFSKYNEEIKVEQVYDSTYFMIGILLKCGDMKIYFPYYRYLLWIIDVVNKYNEELRKINENVKKKQLKMEGF